MDKREVNFEETINPPSSVEETGEDAETSIEETDTQSESSPDENQKDESVESEESAESIEETTEETDETEESKTVPTQEPTTVEGETPRERAMRLEMTRVKRALHQERAKKLFSDGKTTQDHPLSEEEKEFLQQYNQDEVQSLEKIIDVIGKKKGWVKKDEFQTTTYQSQAQEVLDEFLDAHPEYSPEKDKDNVLWNAFQETLSLYKRPDNPRAYKKLFDRVHADVFGIKQGTVNTKQINAQKEKIKVASHQGASSGAPKLTRRETPQVNSDLGNYLKGFSEEEKKEILGA